MLVTDAGTLIGRLLALEGDTIRFRTLEDRSQEVERRSARTATFEAQSPAEPAHDLAAADPTEDLVITRDGDVHAGRVETIDATSVVTVQRSFRRTDVHQILFERDRTRVASTKEPEEPPARCWSGEIAISTKGANRTSYIDASGECTGKETGDAVFMHWETHEALDVVLEERGGTLMLPTRGQLRFRSIDYEIRHTQGRNPECDEDDPPPRYKTQKRRLRGSWRASDFPNGGPGLLVGTYGPEGGRIRYQIVGEFLAFPLVHFHGDSSVGPGDPREPWDPTLYQESRVGSIGSDVDEDGDPLTDAGSLVFAGRYETRTSEDHRRENLDVRWNLRPGDCPR